MAWYKILVTNYSNSRLTRTKFGKPSLFVTLCILIIVSVSGCTSRTIYQNKSFNPPVYFGTHLVRKDDTLYSIAWRYGRDFKELAEENKIRPPYVISLGQKISLERGSKTNSLAKNGVQKKAKAGSNVTKRKAINKTRTNITKIKKHNNFKDIKWKWPHLGPILATYSLSGGRETKTGVNGKNGVNKGIDIAGKLGDSVFSAAAGEVVYAGSGLLGYGNLVIINHDERYLSAYAHNRVVLVKEGQQVKQREKIAEMGRSGLGQPTLHFEIRKNGDPVNPLKHLPRRK